jgi:hypothetical protein
MCRVAVSRTPRNRAPETQVAPIAQDADLYGQLQAMPEIKEEMDFNKLFTGADDLDIEAGK